jgi:hypothetical protein
MSWFAPRALSIQIADIGSKLECTFPYSQLRYYLSATTGIGGGTSAMLST